MLRTGTYFNGILGQVFVFAHVQQNLATEFSLPIVNGFARIASASGRLTAS
jgi:hypothetical protein